MASQISGLGQNILSNLLQKSAKKNGATDEASDSGASKQTAKDGCGGDAVQVSFSTGLKLLQFVQSLSEDQKSEFHDFMKNVHSSIQDGSFDAKKLAQEAPDSLKQFAAENGQSVEDVLKGMKDHFDNRPIAKGNYNMDSDALKLMTYVSGLDEADTGEFHDFMKSVHDSLKDGGFDADKLAQSAPDSIKKYAEENGESVQEILNQMRDRFDERQAFQAKEASAGDSSQDSDDLAEKIFNALITGLTQT